MHTKDQQRYWRGINTRFPRGVDPLRMAVEHWLLTGPQASYSGITIATPRQVASAVGIPVDLARYYLTGNPNPPDRALLEEAMKLILCAPAFAMDLREWDSKAMMVYLEQATSFAISKLGAWRVVPHLLQEYAQTNQRVPQLWSRWREQYAKLLRETPDLENEMLLIDAESVGVA